MINKRTPLSEATKACVAKLNEILLSDNVCERFIGEYTHNAPFREELLNILPETEQCFNQPQRTVWHIYNVMEHILHSVEEINKLSRDLEYSQRLLLAYTMFFHDMGKPMCHSTKLVNGKPSDSFLFHNKASEQIALRALPQMGFDESETAQIAKLVKEHDIFLLLSENPSKSWQIKLSDEFIREFVKDLDSYGDGWQLLDYLFRIGVADNKAQNSELTAQSIAFIERIKRMADQLR